MNFAVNFKAQWNFPPNTWKNCACFKQGPWENPHWRSTFPVQSMKRWRSLLRISWQMLYTGIWNLSLQELRSSFHLITQVFLLRMKLFKEELIYFARSPHTCDAHVFVISHWFTCHLAIASSILQENSSFLYSSVKTVRNNLLKLLFRRCWFNKWRCFKRIHVVRNHDWKLLQKFLLKKIGIVFIYFYDKYGNKKGTCCLSNTTLNICFPHTLCFIDVTC